eukprot:6185889-Pleurochrysis_carterae.AAC.1
MARCSRRFVDISNGDAPSKPNTTHQQDTTPGRRLKKIELQLECGGAGMVNVLCKTLSYIQAIRSMLHIFSIQRLAAPKSGTGELLPQKNWQPS